jgi:hypothetical protein
MLLHTSPPGLEKALFRARAMLLAADRERARVRAREEGHGAARAGGERGEGGGEERDWDAVDPGRGAGGRERGGRKTRVCREVKEVGCVGGWGERGVRASERERGGGRERGKAREKERGVELRESAREGERK